jgi:DNA-binding NtrC family response regulator
MVLVVDNDEDLLRCYESILEEIPLPYFSSNDPEQAYAWFEENKPRCGLIITGHHFQSRKTGFWLVQQIKNKSQISTFTLLLTGDDLSPPTQDLSLFDLILYKPIDLKLLNWVIRSCYVKSISSI